MDDKTLLNYVPASFDPLAKWRREAEQFAAEAEQGREEVRAEEVHMRETPENWENWYLAMLQRHLADHMAPSLEGIAEGVGALYSELRHRADKQAETIKEQGKTINTLQLELAQLAIKLSELRTDLVLHQMPISGGTSRGAVN
jgi:hypothetical protein